jgi:hypothetical protein
MKTKSIGLFCQGPVAPAVLKVLFAALIGAGLLLAMMTLQSCSKAAAGPNGGDVVTLNNGQAKAEVVANADTGEVMVHTWDQNLKNSQPIESRPLMIGSGDQSVELQPHPIANDRSGFSSRFYGQADWLRGGHVQHGWLGSAGQSRQDFAWNNCWRGGQAHGPMWSEMGEHRRGMMGRGPGPGMGHP